ncbi:MAG TPA: hypothetical protein VH228_01755 [Nocardioides sp.]|jgi:hypothetical protein|nr:hypothetical protein [Nocardioides sp.]
MSAESSPAARRSIRHSVRHPVAIGLLGGLLVYTGLVLLWMVTQPLFLTGDESSHVDYAYQVTHGRIPVAGGPMAHEFPELGQRGDYQYTSNHPPAYHALVGPLVRVAAASDHPRIFLMLARVLTACIGGAVVLTLVATAATVFRRPRERALAMIGTAGLSGSLAAMVGSSSSIRNDALAVLLTCLTLLVLARAARGGQRPATVALVAGLCALGMLTRISFLPVWLLAVAAVAVLELWPLLRPRRPTAAVLRRAVLSAVVVLLAPLLGAGWFYVLSLHRYGDLTGGSAAYPIVADRAYLPGAQQGPLAFMLRPSTWWDQIEQLGGGIVPLAGHTAAIYPVVGVAAVAVLLFGVVAAARRRGSLRDLLDVPARWILVCLALVAAAAYVEMAWHVSQKGGDSQRYLLNGIGFWAIGGTAVFLAGPARLFAYLVTSLTALLSVGSVAAAVAELRRRRLPADGGWFHTLVHGVELGGFTAGKALVTGFILVVVVGLVLQLVALHRLSSTPAPSGVGTMPTPRAAERPA